jgi:DNA mismatch repair protein MutL
VPIRVLPEILVREIAAGEVITRPADAVKELLENALDAGATRIDVEVRAGGLDLIRVTDDGTGIPASDLPLAARRFATSKLLLESGLPAVSTLGFRGEALWSIAFAAQVSLTSRPAAQLGGMRLLAHHHSQDARHHQDGGEVTLEPVACPAGTSVEVRALFAEFPARKASLESPAMETRRVAALVSRYALHHPDVSWRLMADGESRLSHTPGGFREAIATVYGALSANRMLEVALEDGGYALHGITSRPELARPRRDRVLIAVNGRPVELEDAVMNAILRAYTGLLPKGHAPISVLNLRVPPESVNQNIHPGKLRVAFLQPERIESLLLEGIGSALREHPLVRAAPEPRVVTGPVRAYGTSFPALHLIGAYRDAYLIAEGDGDLWLIDQHAAHERVIFEELEQAFDAHDALELPEPELVTLSGAEITHLEERRAELESWGLMLEPFGAGLYRVRSVPAVLVGLPVQNVVLDVISHALGAQDARNGVLARLACHPALKAGHRLSQQDATALLEALRQTRIPWACPHGRPTALRLTERDLAHQFGRRSPRDVPRDGDEPVNTRD